MTSEMNDFGKDRSSINNKLGGNKDEPENFYGFSLDTSRQNGSDTASAKPEELQPLKTTESTEIEPELDLKPTLESIKLEKMNEFPEKRDSIKSNGNNNAGGGGGKQEKKRCEDFEEILELLGSEGKFQKFLLYGILCPIVTLSPFLILNTVFMWDIPDHWCHVPGRVSSMSLEEWKNSTLPWEKGPDGQMRHSQCEMLDTSTGNATACQHGWEYDTSDYSSTIPSEYDWVCDKLHYATDCFMWGSIGSAIGTIIFGIMADRFGRKPVFFLACFSNLIFKTASLFIANHFFLYKVCQLFGGFAFPAVFSMPAMITAETSGPSYRAWIYAVTWMIWVVGNAIIPFVAMICRGWFLFGCVAAIPGLVLLIYVPILQESPRWQITTGKTHEAIKVIHKIAKVNGKTVDPDVIERMVHELAEKAQEDAKNTNVGVWTLFSKFNLAKNTVMLTTALTINILLYYGVTLNTTKMAGNKFINYFLLALIELPGGWIAGKLVEKTGRRWTQAGFFLLCTISCIICSVAVAFPNSTVIVIIAALGIKLGVSVTSLVCYLQATEIFPTQLRSTGSGLASTVASIIGIFGPYIVYTGTVHVSFPYAILFVSSVIGMVSSSCLPETFRQNLPETIEDADSFGKGVKFWSYLPQSQDAENVALENRKNRKN